MATARALAVLGAMYVAQGLVYGFAAFVLLPTLAARGVPLEHQTGIVALAGLPWVFKLAWGPVVDTFARPGRRPARFAAVAMVAIAVALWTMAGIAPVPDEVGALALTWLGLNVALSLQDVATDAIALDAIARHRRGLANGVMLAGHHVGVEALGGIAMGAMVAAQGLPAALRLMAVIVLGLAAALVFAPAPTGAATSGPRRSPRATLRRIAGDPSAATVAAVAAGVLFADVLTSALSGEFWIHAIGWSAESVAARLPWVLLPANLIGFGVAAALADRFGHRTTAAVGTVALGASWAVFAMLWPWWRLDGVLLPFVALQTLATAALYVGLHAALMDATASEARATHFAVLTALLNAPRVLAPLVAAPLLGALGWSGLFVACAVVQIGWGFALRRLPATAPS